VTRIVTFDGDIEEAVAGQSVTLCLADEIDQLRLYPRDLRWLGGYWVMGRRQP
jgi:hypothetical protein